MSDAPTIDRAALAGLCDVFVPAVRPPAGVGDPHGYFALTASAAGTHEGVATVLERLLSEEEIGEVNTLLGVLRVAGVGKVPYQLSQGLLRTLGALDDEAAEGIAQLRAVTLAVHHGGVRSDGTNPVWAQLGYPGPPTVERRRAQRLPVQRPPSDATEWTVDADVVVVGSGAGGGVVAARLAAGGKDVLVLEAGGAHEEQDFHSDEIGAFDQLYWRGGFTTTEDGNVALLAGGTLGGGTTVNWSNCVPPPGHVLEEWGDAGVPDLDGDEFEGHLAAVGRRIGASDAHTELNVRNERLLEGAKALGWEAHVAARNVDPDLEDPDATGHTGFGDVTGAKLGSLRTWLPDAVADGARIATDVTVERVLVAGGRAAGVVGWYDDGTRRVRVHVNAPTVVVAAGALETPAVLLRSGIGGPATGRFLRLHPTPVLTALYPDAPDGWRGPPQGGVVTERSSHQDGHGYLLETGHWHPALIAASLTWPDARDAKLVLGRSGQLAGFIAVTRERGSGSVTLDANGEGLVHYPLDDPFDDQLYRAGLRDMVRMHHAAGAQVIIDIAPGRNVLRRGDGDPEEFADRIAATPLGAGGRRLFSAHQMGSARMGDDPRTSVADPDGQLHDTPGVWVGDTSVFPTAVGSNPMLTCMAMAHRTADRILAAG